MDPFNFDVDHGSRSADPFREIEDTDTDFFQSKIIKFFKLKYYIILKTMILLFVRLLFI